MSTPNENEEIAETLPGEEKLSEAERLTLMLLEETATTKEEWLAEQGLTERGRVDTVAQGAPIISEIPEQDPLVFQEGEWERSKKAGGPQGVAAALFQRRQILGSVVGPGPKEITPEMGQRMAQSTLQSLNQASLLPASETKKPKGRPGRPTNEERRRRLEAQLKGIAAGSAASVSDEDEGLKGGPPEAVAQRAEGKGAEREGKLERSWKIRSFENYLRSVDFPSETEWAHAMGLKDATPREWAAFWSSATGKKYQRDRQKLKEKYEELLKLL